MAENSPTVCGEQTSHLAATVSCGSVCITCGPPGRSPAQGTLKKRIRGCRAAAISAFAFMDPPTDICMFDWPEQSQTLPKSTSRTSMVCGPVTVIVCGPPAGKASNLASHLPWASATAVAVLPASLTVTSLLGCVQPQTVVATSRCKTV